MVVTPVALSNAAEALGIGGRSHVALVGGGGKTTLLHALGDQLRGRVVLTTTTKMVASEHGGRSVLIGVDDQTVIDAATERAVLVWSRVDGPKAVGVDPQRCDAWFGRVDHVIVEADGSRRRPFKAPGPFEPVIPSTATLVLSVIGADALGRVIADQCHRPLRVAALAGCGADRRLDPILAAKVILHERAVTRSVPTDAEMVVVVTKVDDSSRSQVDELMGALHIEQPNIRSIAIAARTP